MSRDGGPLYIPLSSFVRFVALFGWFLLITNRVAMVSRFLAIALAVDALPSRPMTLIVERHGFLIAKPSPRDFQVHTRALAPTLSSTSLEKQPAQLQLVPSVDYEFTLSAHPKCPDVDSSAHVDPCCFYNMRAIED